MNALEITRKDLQLLLRDRRALVTLIALPIMLIATLGMSTGRLFNDASDSDALTIAFVDNADTLSSHRLRDSLRRMGDIEVEVFKTREDAWGVFDNDGAHGLLVVEETFPDRVEEVKLRDIFHISDGQLQDGLESLDIEFQAAAHSAVTGRMLNRLLFSAAVSSIMPEVAEKYPLVRRLAQPAEGAKVDEDTEPETQVRIDDGIYQFAVPTYTVLFVFFLITVMGRSVLQERDLGTLARLRLAPIPDHAVLLGKTIPFLVISLVQTGILFVSGKLLFGMSWGDQPWALVPVMLCTSLSATGLGLLFATMVKTDSQVSAYGTLIVLGAAAISGCLIPRSWLPPVMKSISLVTPHAWALDAYRELLSSPPPDLTIVWRSCSMLLVFATVFFLSGLWRFRRMS